MGKYEKFWEAQNFVVIFSKFGVIFFCILNEISAKLGKKIILKTIKKIWNIFSKRYFGT